MEKSIEKENDELLVYEDPSEEDTEYTEDEDTEEYTEDDDTEEYTEDDDTEDEQVNFIIYSDAVFEGVIRGGKPFYGTMTYKNGAVYKGGFDSYGKRSLGKMTYANGDVYEYKSEIGINSWKGTINYKNGDFFDGEFRDDKPHYGKIIYTNGNIFKGYFKNGKPSKGTKTRPDGVVYRGKFENGAMLDVSVELKLSNTGKSYYSFRMGKNNFQRKVKYHLDGYNEVTINYNKINEILNGKADGINSLDDLIRNKVIKGVNNFNELKDFAKKMLQDKMFGDIKKGFEGAKNPLSNLLLLSSVDRVEQLKKTRFQTHYIREGEDSLRKDYGSLKGFLESVGININTVEEDYISLKVDTIPPEHAVSVILDIKKMKELKNLQPEKSLDEAIADKKVIHCFDSSRILGTIEDKIYYNMGALDKNCDFVNLVQQELGSCWFHAVAANLTAMKHSELVQRIGNGEIELYDTEHRLAKKGDEINEFQFKQLNTIIEISKNFNIELTDDNRAAVDVIIRNKMKKKVEETVPNMSKRVLGSTLDNKIREQTKNNKSGKASRQRQEEKLRTNFTREEGESDFAYRVRLEDKVSEEAKKHRKALDIRKDDIEKLKAEKKSMKESVDDSLLIGRKSSIGEEIRVAIQSLDGTCEPRENIFPPFGDRKELSSFRERERARRSSKIERQV